MININNPSPGDINPTYLTSVLPGDTSDSRNSTLIIFGRYAYRQDGVSRARIVAIPCWPF